jgi:YVTN family beta-propeller protein
MNAGQTRARLVQAGAVLAVVALVAGCGSAYRSPVTPIGTSGPPAQVQSYAVVVSAPSPTTPGIVTIIDYSGDTVLAEAPIGPGPSAFTIDSFAAYGYTVNSDGTLSNFPISTTLQAKQVDYSTLSSAAQTAPPHPPLNLFASSTGVWAADLNGSYADVFTGFPQAFKVAVPVATTPVTIVGPAAIGQYDYAISQNIANPTGVECNTSPRTVQSNGEADALGTSAYTVSASIPLDPTNPSNDPNGTKNALCPVYAVQSADNMRIFVLNRGSDTISVIDNQTNTLDSCTPFLNQNGQMVTCHPSLPLSTSAGLPQDANEDVPAVAGPVYAEYNKTTSQLVVADYDGNTISVIDVSMDQYGNDSPTFGTTFTIPVGNNPASVTVLADGSRAYTANQTDQTVTIVNLSSHTVEKTLPVIGHPRTVVSTQNATYGKVYVASPDSPYLTILRTDLDIVDTTILVEGNIVDVRATSQNGSTANAGNAIDVSRVPGYGEPCYLPPTLLTAAQLTKKPSLCSKQP